MIKWNTVVPDYDLKILNEREAVAEMGEAVKTSLLRRLAFGQGSRGALPRPKEGGQPYSRTGTLVRSIAVGVNSRQRRDGEQVWQSVVRAWGDRPANENVEKKVKAARAAQRQRRAELAVALTLSSLGGNTVDAFYLRKKPTKSGQIFKTGSVRVRTADSNAALAGILSVPPKDARSKKGNRGVYRVFEPSPEYVRVAYLTGVRRIQAALVASRMIRAV